FTHIACTFQGIEYPPDLIRRLCLNGREEEYRKTCYSNREAVDLFLFERDNKRFASEYRKFCDSLKDEKYLFTEAVKAGIDWLIYRESGSTALAFKVGHIKKYIVKDAPEFIKAFKTGQTTEYGKDLILTHDPDNFNETDAAVIKLLMAAKYTKGRRSDKNNKRYITVPDSVLGSMLELLAGRTVSYNDLPCRIRLDSSKIRLQISSDYVPSVDIDTATQEFLELVGKGYLLTFSDKDDCLYMDRVEGTSEEIGLIRFVQGNPGTSIRPILGDFKKNIYSRFFEMIDVDKTVQADFKLSEIRLNTYFDYDREGITAKTRIYRDGTEVTSGHLTERIDQVKLEHLQNYLSALGFSNGLLENDSQILAFLRLDFTRLKSLTNVYLSEDLQKMELRTINKPVIRVTYDNNIVSVFLEKSEYNEDELAQILAAIRKKKKFILMSGNRIVDLDSEAARDFGEAVSDFGMNPKDLYKKKTVSMITAIKAFSHERSCRVDKYLRDMIEEIRSFKEAEIPLPKIAGELRPYQEEGFKWMSILANYGMGGILADDMGLGKTIQVIALIKSDMTRKPSLVVCPKSLIFNWLNEFGRFDPKTPVTAIYGPDSKRSEIINAIDYKKKGVYITSYDSLRNDIDKYTGQFNYGILDEAQYIKNVHAQKTKSVKELKVTHRFALTGTPIENSVVDLWSIFDYIMPGYFEELTRFKESDTADIARKSAPFILRRVKEDVLEDLPPKYERILSADMSDGQRKLYEAMRLEARERLESGGKAFDILPWLTRLRQVCVDPAMFVDGYDQGSGKMDMLRNLIPEYLEQGHRLLIFSQFVKALEEVRLMLHDLGIATYFLSGATPAQDRIEMMDSFNNGSGTDVFLISLKAGGTGLNLTGADTVIHIDPWWNVAAENQASDRTHRIGQTRNVEVIKLIAADSIEQRVVELQDIKKEVIKQVISDDDGSVTSASLEDIAFVLK
ncbi:MAG: DEAD/DEAH box helicase, partial [Blautia sp.]|nr:DEAD/DEAH box helicase [Blautia sp.]